MWQPLLLLATAGTVAYLGSRKRFVGDGATKGDVVAVPPATLSEAMGTTAGIVPGIPATAGLVLVRVEKTTPEELYGPVVGFSAVSGPAGQQTTTFQSVDTPIGPIRVPRSAVVSIVGKA